MAALLIAFAGLPGTGKTTLARRLARQLGAVYLRIDTIEQAIRDAGVLQGEVGPAGYLAAYGLAAENLRLGRSVVADSVNPLQITRESWREVAAAATARLVEIEVVCSDAAEHRRRVETRRREPGPEDIEGLTQPAWQEVVDRAYEPWDRPPLVVDTAGRSADAVLADLIDRLGPKVVA